MYISYLIHKNLQDVFPYKVILQVRLQLISENEYTLKPLKMEKIKSTILIQKLSLVYLAFYLVLLISGDLGGTYPNLNMEGIIVYSLFALFIIGLSISWFNKILTGIIFLLWNLGIWTLTLFIFENPNGFGIVLGFPLVVLGIFFLITGIEEKKKIPLKLIEKWKTILQLLITTYTVFYILVIIEGITGKRDIGFYSYEGIILIALLLIYTTGFIFSWKKELTAGIIFIFWSIGVVYIFIEKFAVSDDGPWVGAWLFIFIQSLLYFGYHFKYKIKQIPD